MSDEAIIYYYTDRHGNRHGSISHYKVKMQAEQNYYLDEIKQCKMNEFRRAHDYNTQNRMVRLNYEI